MTIEDRDRATVTSGNQSRFRPDSALARRLGSYSVLASAMLAPVAPALADGALDTDPATIHPAPRPSRSTSPSRRRRPATV